MIILVRGYVLILGRARTGINKDGGHIQAQRVRMPHELMKRWFRMEERY